MTIPAALGRRRLAPDLEMDLSRAWPAAVSLGLALAVVVTRLPLAGRYLFNWDSLQFALGVRRFDILSHRPHPPGYIGYIAIGRLLHYGLGLDVNAGLVGLSIAVEAATVGGLYLVARSRSGEFGGWAAALLLLFSPLYWLYGETALTYGLEPGMALLAFVLLCRALGRRGRGLALAAAVIGLEGAIRPTAELFLLPMLAYTAWRCWRLGGGRGRLVASALALGGATAAWLVPLLLLSGGPAAYLFASSQLAARVSRGSAFWRAGLPAVAANVGWVLDGMLMAAGLSAVFLVAAPVCHRLVPGARPSRPRLRTSSRDDSILLLLWVLPACAMYTLVHIGQLAYVLFALPALLLLAGPAFEASAAAVMAARGAAAGRRLASVFLALCLVASIAFYFSGPQSLAAQVAHRDQRVAALTALLDRVDPGRSLLVADPEGPSSYRTAMYYFDRFQVVAIGQDRNGRAGEMFSNRQGAPEYDLTRFEHSGPLHLPTGVTAVILDQEVLGNIGDRWVLGTLRLGRGFKVWTVPLLASDPPARMGHRIYLHGSDCPCVTPGTARSLPALHESL